MNHVPEYVLHSERAFQLERSGQCVPCEMVKNLVRFWRDFIPVGHQKL